MHTKVLYYYQLYDNDSMKCRFGWRLDGSVAWPWSSEIGRADRDQVQVRGGQKVWYWMGGWEGGWMDGWMGGRARLRIAYSNQKLDPGIVIPGVGVPGVDHSGC